LGEAAETSAMALTNRERQARWRARLKEAASKNSRIEDMFREHMRAVLYDEALYADCATEAELEVRLQAADAIIAESDEKLIEVLNALILAWHEDETLARSAAGRERASQPARSGY
jgi:uncharacterized phage protein gp47/JayE